ncbi:MAG: Rpn family recombination-promoting nuclease/putative transposase, partial [Bacteroidota bacterium]
FDDNKNDDKLIHFVELKDQDCKVFYDKLKFIYIELPKFNKKEEELESHFDKWLFVFKHLSDLQNRPTKLQDKVFKKLFESAEIAKFSPQEREAYEESLKYYRDIKNVVDTSKAEGKMEEKFDIAAKLKEKGMPLEEIANITGLTVEQIANL